MIQAHETLLELDEIGKSYEGIPILSNLSFSAPNRKVVALVGENGAGKSTLFNILSGITVPSHGRMTLRNADFQPQNYPTAWQAGVSRVFQEQALVQHVPVYENIVLGQEHRFTRFGTVQHRRMIETAQSIVDEAGLHIDVRRRTGDYDFSTRQSIEIARACLGPLRIGGIDSPLVLLDEPTSALDRRDEDAFFALVERIRRIGSLLFVSHRLTEVLSIADEIHVLRDGAIVASFNTGEADEKLLHEYMVGRSRSGDYYHEANQRVLTGAPETLAVNRLSGDGFEDISFSLKAGEILGIGGLLDSGKSRLGRAIAGIDPCNSGEISLLGQKPGRPSHISRAVREGVGYVPAERLVDGMIAAFSTAWNISLASGGDIAANRFGFWRGSREKQVAVSYIKGLGIRSATPNGACSRLSGGNQQKVVLARWLSRKLNLLILDNPTRGVDAGAKEEIYRTIRSLAEQGVAILIITDELLELIGLSNRILVLRAGSIATALDTPAGAKPGERDLIPWMLPEVEAANTAGKLEATKPELT